MEKCKNNILNRSIEKILFIIIMFFLSSAMSSAFEKEDIIDMELRSYNKTRKTRILVMDFSSSGKKAESKRLAGLIRKKFSGNSNFATLNIDEINSLISAGGFKKHGLEDPKEVAVYIGKKLRAHKIIIGNVEEEQGKIVTAIQVIDINDRKVQFDKTYKAKRADIDERLTSFTNNVMDSMLGVQPNKGTTGFSLLKFNPGFTMSAGFLGSAGNISEKLNNSYLITFQFNLDAPYIPWTKVVLTIGYSNFKGDNIDEGGADLTFMPITLALSTTFPVTKNPLIPKPVLIFGMGGSYLSLKKAQYSDDVSGSGFNYTLVLGLGGRISPYKNTLVQLEFLYHYIYEKVSVNYLYVGVRVGMVFEL
ncbi:hypothetical protein ACFL20_07745 [Spirochaetota bacterium]